MRICILLVCQYYKFIILLVYDYFVFSEVIYNLLSILKISFIRLQLFIRIKLLRTLEHIHLRAHAKEIKNIQMRTILFIFTQMCFAKLWIEVLRYV